MKDSAQYEEKIKSLVAQRAREAPARRTDRIALLVEGIMAEDTTPAKASSAMSALTEEFVDFNELRVSPIRDVVELLGEEFPGVRAKANAVTGALQVIFDHANSLCLDYLAKMTKREVRSVLREKIGLSPYAESVLTLFGFGGHAIPVDNLLMEALKLDGYIHPDSDLPDLQGFLERIAPGKDAMSWHEALRDYAAGAASKVAKERTRRQRKAKAKAKAKADAEAKVKAKAEAKAKAKAEAKVKAKAEAKVKAKAEAKVKAKAEAKVKAKAKAKAKARAKPVTRKKTKSPTKTAKAAGKNKAPRRTGK